MRNRDNAAMSIETLFEKKNYLDVHLAPGTVNKKEFVKIFNNLGDHAIVN